MAWHTVVAKETSFVVETVLCLDFDGDCMNLHMYFNIYGTEISKLIAVNFLFSSQSIITEV